jgi:hypothetical protein
VNDLRDRLQELADAATRDGTTPGPAAAIRRGRRRRRRVLGTVASLLAVALVAGAAGIGAVADRTAPALDAPAPTRPRPGGKRPAKPSRPVPVEQTIFDDLAREVRRCPGGVSARVERIGYVRSRTYRRIWMAVAKPPAPGDSGICWTSGVFELDGAGGYGGLRRPKPAATPLTASGTGGTTASIEGQVAKRAVRVRVRFRDGRPPLTLPVVDTGGDYPVNLYVGFFPQGHQGARDDTEYWAPSEVTALDAAGRPVASCTAGPPWNAPTSCPGN